MRPSLRDVDRGRGVERGQAAQTVQTVRGRDKAGMGRGQVGARPVSPPCFQGVFSGFRNAPVSFLSCSRVLLPAYFKLPVLTALR